MKIRNLNDVSNHIRKIKNKLISRGYTLMDLKAGKKLPKDIEDDMAELNIAKRKLSSGIMNTYNRRVQEQTNMSRSPFKNWFGFSKK